MQELFAFKRPNEMLKSSKVKNTIQISLTVCVRNIKIGQAFQLD